MDLYKILNDIETRLDETEEEVVLSRWKSFADGTNESEPFQSPGRTPKPVGYDIPYIHINDAVKDEELMLISQFVSVLRALSEGHSGILTIRSNYGVGIIPTMLGAEPFIMPYDAHTLPNARHLSKDKLERLAESDLPDFNAGFGASVLSVGEKFMEIKEKYPKIDKYVRIDHPDCQGPFDLCELLYGSDMFYEMYDNPDFIHVLLRKITDYYKAFMEHWFTLSPNTDGYHSYGSWMHKGTICLRDDSAMNLSPEFYEEFIFPYDRELLKHFGGGAIHFCGKGDHYIEKMCETEYLYGINMSQPHYNDMSVILRNTVNKGINLYTCYFDMPKDEKYCLSRLSM